MLDKIVYAGVSNPSFAQGSQDLAKLAEVEVSVKQVERVARRIGAERCCERDAEVATYQALPLVERKAVPAGVRAPEVAVVGVDGGRLQILERQQGADPVAAAAATAEAAAEEATLAEEEGKSRHWREDKIGVLMTMKSSVSACDPCPEIPEAFVDPTRILQLARELKKKAPPTDDGLKPNAQADEGAQVLAENSRTWEPPQVQERRLLASRRRWAQFGPQVAQAAWAAGFYEAPRRAFIGDGAENNWTLWRQHFSSFVPILDFIHALSYVFAAATVARPFAEGWPCYMQWIGWVWQGQVAQVIAALAQRQVALGTPAAGEAETSPRQVVARALGYLQNHQERMRYPEYRQQGLPITSSYVESAVKQFNQRVKGTEKFWTEDGSEAILQLRADTLSDHEPLTAFWQRRQARSTGQRPYRQVA